MFKKLFIIAAFSVALLASTEAFAGTWGYLILRIQSSSSFINRRTADDALLISEYGGELTGYEKGDTLDEVLGLLGRGGWELVSVTEGDTYDRSSYRDTKMYFKKPL